MPDRIRVGIVGASPRSWAAAAHLPALAHLDDLTVTAVATTRTESAREAAGTFGIRHAFASAAELAFHPEVDLVVASVKVPAHAAVIRAALAAGKHVFAEWPLGVDLAEASALADAAAAAGVVHAVNLQAYHSPGARFVADLLADGRIGAVESVSMTAAGDPLGGSRITRSLAWSTEPEAGNNLLTVMAGHALAALERVANRGPPGTPRLRHRRASPPDARGYRASRPDRRPPAARPAGRGEGRMKILIIGASGYIGSHVAAALADSGHEVSALRRPGGAPLPARYGHVTGDLAEPGALTAAAAGYDRVLHAGAPIDDGTDRAGAEALLASGSPLLYTTGAAVLGAGAQDEDSPADPHPIAAGRPAIEQLVLRAGGWVIRPGMVYGDDGGLVHGLLTTKAAERGTGVYIGPPGTRWPVVYVDDLAALYLAVITRAAPGTIWHGASETIRLDAIATALGRGQAASWPVSEARAELGLLADLFTRDQDVSAAKTRAALGWAPACTSIVKCLTA